MDLLCFCSVLCLLCLCARKYSKPVLSGHTRRPKIGFPDTSYRFVKVLSIAERFKGSILQYF